MRPGCMGWAPGKPTMPYRRSWETGRWKQPALARPVITGDAPAVGQALVHGEHLYLCDRANPQALADAVRTLKANPDLRRRLAQNGYHLYRQEFDLQHNGARYAAHLRELMKRHHDELTF